MPKSRLNFSWILLTLAYVLSWQVQAASLPAIEFTSGQEKTAIEIIGKLEERHYREQRFDDELSSRFLDAFIDDLDPTKSYFLASDIKEFDQYRFVLDDQVKAGKLGAGQVIFERYQARVVSRLESLLAKLEDEKYTFDFTTEDELDIDTDDAQWAANMKASDATWDKRLKSAVLNLKLADKSVKEAREVLVKRYTNQLSRVKQQDNEDVFELFMNSLAQLYDPHTTYFSPRSWDNFNISMSLSLEGIGAVLQVDDEYVKVLRLVTGGPAARGGQLKPADKIVAVGEGMKGEFVDVIGWRLDEVVKLIRGPSNSLVRLDVIPANASNESERKMITIKREKVKLEDQAAKSEVLEINRGGDVYKLGVIDVPTFYFDFEAYRRRDPNYKSTTRDVHRLVNELEKQHVDGIILDLRNNGGGSLQEASMLTDLFIDPGPIVQIRQSNQVISRHNRSREDALYRGPLIVLINRLSASASEIFAGAIQDYNRGIIVGSASFGKGTVQSLTPLREGQLKITESKFYRVSGDSTQHRGIVPDVKMPGLVDFDEVGESSYENALPWDQIHAVPHDTYFSFADIIPALVAQHEQRVKTDADFNYLLDQLELMKESREQKHISLNEKERIQEKKDLETRQVSIENRLRKAKGKEPITKLSDLDADKKDSDEGSEEDGEQQSAQIDAEVEEDEEDSLLNETGQIMIDYINMLRKKSSREVANFR